MNHAARLTTPALLAVGMLAACSEEPKIRFAAPAEPRATLVLEPSRLRLGEVATLELAVVTAPGTELRHFEPPTLPAGLELLGIETSPPEDQGLRRVHRLRLRVRARSTGAVTWPRSRVVLEEPDAAPRELAIGPRVIEVVSVLPEHPDRLTPFGIRGPPLLARGSTWAPAALGAAAALAAVGLTALARRGLARGARADAREPAPRQAPWARLREDLARVHEASGSEPFAAAHRLSAGLRHYLAGRFGADAVARTSEELARSEPPFALRSRWPALVALLGDLDTWRFRPEGDTAARQALTARLRSGLTEVERFVDDTVPPEERG